MESNSASFTELGIGNNAGKRAGLEKDDLDPFTPQMVTLERYSFTVCLESFKFDMRNVFLNVRFIQSSLRCAGS